MKEINALLHAGLCKIQLLELVRRLCDASHELAFDLGTDSALPGATDREGPGH